MACNLRNFDVEMKIQNIFVRMEWNGIYSIFNYLFIMMLHKRAAGLTS